MPYTPPTLAQIDTRTQTDITTRLPTASPQVRRGIVAGIGRALTGAVYALYGYLANLFGQAVPTTSTGINLDRWASLWGVVRQQPTYASGPVVFTGSTGSIASGTQLQDASGNVFATTASGTLSAGTVTVTVQATVAGSASNDPAGTILTFVSPISGFSSTATVGTGGITGGDDLWTDEQLLSALENYVQLPPQGGSQNDYETWAYEGDPSITNAWCFPLYSGAGTVRVYIADNTYVGSTAASPTEVTNVQTYIDNVRPVTVATIVDGEQVSGVTVVAPTLQPVNFTIDGISANNQAAVQAALQALFLQTAPEATISLNSFILAIGGANGSGAFTLAAPTASQTATAGNILSMGTITWG
jgi:uncharacterized phage protein gp47/JayE